MIVLSNSLMHCCPAKNLFRRSHDPVDRGFFLGVQLGFFECMIKEGELPRLEVRVTLKLNNASLSFVCFSMSSLLRLKDLFR
jgi:hypothetical protein